MNANRPLRVRALMHRHQFEAKLNSWDEWTFHILWLGSSGQLRPHRVHTVHLQRSQHG